VLSGCEVEFAGLSASRCQSFNPIEKPQRLIVPNVQSMGVQFDRNSSTF
jgi:hypothetical protein